jgi:rhodanese-related sulfurtransferase
MQSRLLAVPARADCICQNDSNDIILEEPEGQACGAGIKNIAPAYVADFAGRAVFIDVREEYELAAGMIEGAMHIPLRLLLADKNAVSGLAKNKAIIVYCQHGVRSKAAAEHLLAEGFGDVSHIEGGFSQLC